MRYVLKRGFRLTYQLIYRCDKNSKNVFELALNETRDRLSRRFFTVLSFSEVENLQIYFDKT